MDSSQPDRQTRRPPEDAARAHGSPYERLRQAILDGEFPPGQPLVESALAKWCGVSRTPVREALMRLEQDGLVQRGERGLTVRERSPEEILDIYETRIALEATVARVAAERRTSLDVLRLQGLLQRLQAATEAGGDARAEANRQFHRAVWKASHNESLIDLLQRLNMHLVRYPATTLSYPGRWEVALTEHREMVEAIVNRDGAAAYEVATKHFTAARDVRLALWEDDIS